MSSRDKIKKLSEPDQLDLIKLLNIGATTIEEAIATVDAINEIVENKPFVVIPYCESDKDENTSS